MGAYEMRCSVEVTKLKDTILVGDPYTFHEMNLDEYGKKVGSYHFADTLTSAEGCDSIVKLTLAVRPEKRDGGYYVKTKAQGDGSGIDWENAMSAEDFATYLPLVYDGETFYIAEGTYKSTYVDSELGRLYNINSSVTLIGGYPDTITTIGVPPMPETFTTTLSANVNKADYIYVYKEDVGEYSFGGFLDNDSVLIRVNGSHTVSLYGITLSGVNSYEYGAITMNEGGILNLDQCTIKDNLSSAVVANGATVNVTSTLATRNISCEGAVFRLNDSELNVSQSSFHENIAEIQTQGTSTGGVAYLSSSKANFTNNTIANNWGYKGGVLSLSNSQVSLDNNTLIGNQSSAKVPNGSFVSSSDDISSVTLFGNMIVGNGNRPINMTTVKSEEFNIFSSDFNGVEVDKDMFMSPKDYSFVIDGASLRNNSSVYIANVRDNGGHTPSVAIIESMFDGGAVIAIPSDRRKVAEDQRNMLRKDSSCVGAFEFPTYVNFYVKQSPIGDGTGRDWDNAMGDSTFARYFSIVPSGATFYVAAGTYRPLQDNSLYESNDNNNKRYFSSRPVNVFGGYSPSAKEGDVADPSKYKTLLTADFNGDDNFKESTGSYSLFNYENFKDNSSYLMVINSKLPGSVQLKGLTFSGNHTQFRGSSSALSLNTINPSVPLVVSIDSCSFVKTEVGIYSNVDSLAIRNCRFDTIIGTGVSHSVFDNVFGVLTVENSSFTNLNVGLNLYATNINATLKNSTFNNALSLFLLSANSYNQAVDITLDMYHNTFGYSPKSYYGISIPEFATTTAKGNIFNTNFTLVKDGSSTNAMKTIVSDYNLFVENPSENSDAWVLGENDMLVSSNDLVGILPGKMEEDRFIATSSMQKPEDYTNVVALESDVLNEKYIRMPIENAVVKVDQIGTERLDLTSLGAYEFFKGRDTVYGHKIDTVCLGTNYLRNGWELQTDTLPAGLYKYGRFVRGKVATDTLDTLDLHVNPFTKLSVDPVVVTPTLCHGDGFGEVSFKPISSVSGSAFVYIISELNDTMSIKSHKFDSIYENDTLEVGKYNISIVSQTQCVLDTIIYIEVMDRDSLQPMNKIENILTDCANEPTSNAKLSLTGFHPTMKFYHNDELISNESSNDKLVFGEDAAVTSKAELNMSSISVGNHVITAVDACDNEFVVGEFNVIVPANQIVDMKLADYTQTNLACGLDSGFAKFEIVSGASSTFSLTSDEGYNYSLNIVGKDTILELNDLTRGVYNALLKKNSNSCSDSSFATFTISAPEPLFMSLTSNGAACAEGAVKADANGGTGEYTYHWTDPSGNNFETESSKLDEASAGKYICVVEDETHCFSHPDTVAILPNVHELAKLSVDSVATKNITCISGENGTIEVYFSTLNKKQSVACAVTNVETGVVTKNACSWSDFSGLLAIRTLGVGSYSYEVYYGTETCRLDTNSIKGTFSVSAKAVPFEMTPLSVFAPQTCLNPSNGIISNTATGWENDYKALLVTEAGLEYKISPKTEGDITTLKSGLLNGGSFYHKVLDACGTVISTDPIKMAKYEPLSLKVLSHTDSVTCAKATDAEIEFTVDGGVASYLLAYIDDKSFTEKGTIISDDNGKGIHTISYKSIVEGCKDKVDTVIRIAGPDTLSIQYSLNGNCIGSALTPTVSGESGKYTYLWSNGDKEIEGSASFPFDDMEPGVTYSLTVSDVNCAYGYTKSFTIPSAEELPSISHKVYPESEKCHLGNNGHILIKPSLSKKLDFALTATIFVSKVDSKDSIPYEVVLDPDGSCSTPATLSPGYYRVTTRLGSANCDMGVTPVSSVVKVDSLPPLKIKSDFELTDHTCINPNGTASFKIEGWTYTHTADIYQLDGDGGLYRSNVRPSSTSADYVGTFNVGSLAHGNYKVVVVDKCGNSDESESFEILHKPTVIQKIKTEKATCINEPNGVLDFEVQGWTLSHGCELVKNDDPTQGRIVPVLPEKYDTLNKLAHFRINTMPAGKWRIWMANECREAFQYDSLVTVPGIEPYKVELIANESKLKLDCPYSKDGKIVVVATGGYAETLFNGSATTHVKYYGPTNQYVDTIVYVADTSYVVEPVYDTVPVVSIDTIYKYNSQYTVQVDAYDKDSQLIKVDSVIMVYDTIIKRDSVYPQLIDSLGNLVNDTIVRIDSFATTQKVPLIGELDSLSTSPIEYDLFAANPLGRKTGKYSYLDLGAGTYRFTFKTALEGCTDKYDYDTEVTKPDNVNLNNHVLPISCSTFTDGAISLAPRRGAKSYSYFVGHDSTDAYNINRLYKETEDGKIVEHSIGDVNQYRIDTLFDQSDIKKISWSFNPYEATIWSPLNNIGFPDSTDITEEVYYKDGVVMTTPVYSNTHLEKFWHGYQGDYFKSNVVTIANLAPGYYAVLVEDANKCQYRDTFEIKLPPRPSIKFDENLAECDPTKRQILVYASGGWGEYRYNFSDKSVVETTKGEQSDGYRGGEAAHYNKNAMEGWGVSRFLDPGNYSVVVLDEQGCMVEDDNTYEVRSKFTLKIDSTETKCPEDPTATVPVIFKSPVSGMTYDIVEYISPCSQDTLDDCREYTLDTLLLKATPIKDTIKVDLTSLKMRSKTHGLFVYQNDESHCGTYVQGTVVDTFPIFKASRKSVLDVTCGGLNNGQIELYISGGVSPYKVRRNSGWNTDDQIALYENLALKDTSFKLEMRDPDTGEKTKDTTITQHYITLGSLFADTFYLTVIDARACESVVGDTATFDEKIIVKSPEKLEADFASSVVCPAASVTKGGNIFIRNVKGGVKPYNLSYEYVSGNQPYSADPAESQEAIVHAVPGLKVDIKVTDANNCVLESSVEFREGDLKVDTFDFWATSWYEFGDVVALIDVCGPEETFDSVSYVFYDEQGVVDSRIKMMNKRLYIYDLDGNKAAAEMVYRYGEHTKEMVPDGFFESKFKLRSDISKGQAKHLNFFKFEDSSIDVKHINSVRDALAKHTILMKAYFLGCEYQMERKSPLGVINPNNRPDIDPIGQRYQIVDLKISPNPFKSTDKVTVTATFTEKVSDAKLYIYQIDGKSTPTPIDIKPSELTLKNGEYVYTRDFDPSELYGSDAPDYLILLLKTGRDQKSATLLYYGVNDSYWDK